MTTALMLQGAEAQPFWHVLLDNALALTVLVIFLAAAVGAVRDCGARTSVCGSSTTTTSRF